VLQLNVTKTVETLLVGVVEESEGIEESKGSLLVELRRGVNVSTFLN
jgi:hypothetical protein